MAPLYQCSFSNYFHSSPTLFRHTRFPFVMSMSSFVRADLRGARMCAGTAPNSVSSRTSSLTT